MGALTPFGDGDGRPTLRLVDHDRTAAGADDDSLQARLRAEVVAARERLAEMERQHELLLRRIREQAEREVQQILADARRSGPGAGGGERDDGSGATAELA